MNTATPSDVVIKTDHGKKRLRNLNPDNGPEGASVNERMQRPNAVRPYSLDHRTFETFIGSAGI